MEIKSFRNKLEAANDDIVVYVPNGRKKERVLRRGFDYMLKTFFNDYIVKREFYAGAPFAKNADAYTVKYHIYKPKTTTNYDRRNV